jgi:hypothetical protein
MRRLTLQRKRLTTISGLNIFCIFWHRALQHILIYSLLSPLLPDNSIFIYMYPHKIMASFPIQCIKVYIQKCILLLLYSYGLFIHIENLKLKNFFLINKCCQGCAGKGTLIHCWWECKLVQPLWKSVRKFLKKLKVQLSYYPVI